MTLKIVGECNSLFTWAVWRLLSTKAISLHQLLSGLLWYLSLFSLSKHGLKFRSCTQNSDRETLQVDCFLSSSEKSLLKDLPLSISHFTVWFKMSYMTKWENIWKNEGIITEIKNYYFSLDNISFNFLGYARLCVYVTRHSIYSRSRYYNSNDLSW